MLKITEPVLRETALGGDEDARRRYVEEFADEYGNRRATDRPFLAHLLGVDVAPARAAAALDERLWWMLAGDAVDGQQVEELIAPSGGLAADDGTVAIEYRTMVELCALQALWRIAGRLDSAALRTRCLEAAGWHTRELQPDNAINRPWGVAVFVELSLSEDVDEESRRLADLHAQTLVHNACVSFGRPDVLSALILRDAAGQLAD